MGTLEPGQRLIEQKLAASLGIGQPTLREALKELEYEGFVHKIPQKGTYITTFDKKDCRELLEVRMSLEPLVIERAARKLTAEIEKDLSRLVAGMRAAAETFDVPRFCSCDAEFHRKIAALAGNRRLAKTLESILSNYWCTEPWVVNLTLAKNWRRARSSTGESWRALPPGTHPLHAQYSLPRP